MDPPTLVQSPGLKLDLNRIIDARLSGGGGVSMETTTPTQSEDTSPVASPVGFLRRMKSIRALATLARGAGSAGSSAQNAVGSRPQASAAPSGAGCGGIAKIPSTESGWAREHRDRFARSSTIEGDGSFGEVYKGRDLLTREPVAIKVFQMGGARTEKVRADRLAHFQAEVRALEYIARAPHPNVIRMYASYVEQDSPRIVLELCEVSLLELLRREYDLRQELGIKLIDEGHIRTVMKQVFSAVEHCIGIGVYNLDIKLENVMFARNPFVRALDCAANVRLVAAHLDTVRIIDWGFSEVAPRNGYVSLPARSDRNVGSDHYVAPEVGYEGRYYDMAKASSWNLGVVLYGALALRLPWALKIGPDGRRIGQSHVDRANGVYEPLERFAVSKEGSELVGRLIQVQPEDRTSVRDALKHRWFKEAPVSPAQERASSAPIEIKRVAPRKPVAPEQARVHARP